MLSSRLATIKTFLQTFEVKEKGNEGGERKYMDMITEVKQLKRSVIPISLGDIAISPQSGILQHIIENTMRYVEIFEDVIDDILPTLNIYEEPSTPADILAVCFLEWLNSSVIERKLAKGSFLLKTAAMKACA